MHYDYNKASIMFHVVQLIVTWILSVGVGFRT